MSALRASGLYAITGAAACRGDGLLAAVEAAIRGGAGVVQYRDKTQEHARRRREALALAELCREREVVFLVNDDVELARRSGAHGVHVGRDDASLEAAREHLGPEAIIGVSCYADTERALAAQAAGADYVAFGSFHASPTKPDAVRADLSLLRRIRAQLHVPIVAIGGIDADNAADLAAAGADLIAVITALFDAPDIAAAARRLGMAFERARPAGARTR